MDEDREELEAVGLVDAPGRSPPDEGGRARLEGRALPADRRRAGALEHVDDLVRLGVRERIGGSVEAQQPLVELRDREQLRLVAGRDHVLHGRAAYLCQPAESG